MNCDIEFERSSFERRAPTLDPIVLHLRKAL